MSRSVDAKPANATPCRPNGRDWKKADRVLRQDAFVPPDWSSITSDPLPEPPASHEIEHALDDSRPLTGIPGVSSRTLAERRRVARVRGEKGKVVRAEVMGTTKLCAAEDMPTRTAVKLKLKDRVVTKGGVQETVFVERNRRHAPKGQPVYHMPIAARRSGAGIDVPKVASIIENIPAPVVIWEGETQADINRDIEEMWQGHKSEAESQEQEEIEAAWNALDEEIAAVADQAVISEAMVTWGVCVEDLDNIDAEPAITVFADKKPVKPTDPRNWVRTQEEVSDSSTKPTVDSLIAIGEEDMLADDLVMEDVPEDEDTLSLEALEQAREPRRDVREDLADYGFTKVNQD